RTAAGAGRAAAHSDGTAAPAGDTAAGPSDATAGDTATGPSDRAAHSGVAADTAVRAGDRADRAAVVAAGRVTSPTAGRAAIVAARPGRTTRSLGVIGRRAIQPAGVVGGAEVTVRASLA